MSDGPNRYDPEKDLLKKPEFKISEGPGPQISSLANSLADNSSLARVEELPFTDSTIAQEPSAVSRLAQPSAQSSEQSSDRAFGQTFTPLMPVAPKYSGIPYPKSLLLIVCGIAALCWWIEPMRARMVVSILDTKGAQAVDFADAHINLAEALYRNGAHDAASNSLKSALDKVAARPTVDRVQEVSLLLRLAQSQYDGDSRNEAKQTIARAMELLNKKTIQTVPISVCWQLDALARTIVKDTDDHRGRRDLAVQLWRKGIVYFRDPNPVLVANLYSGLAYCQMRNYDYLPAAENFMEFARLTEIRGDRLWRAEHYRQAAYCFNSAGDYTKGKAAATKAMAMCLRLGPSANRELAYSQYHLGQAESNLGLQSSGIKHLNDSLPELKKYFPDEGCYTYALWYLANCYRDIGDRTNAQKLYGQCIKETKDNVSGPDIRDVQKDWDKMH